MIVEAAVAGCDDDVDEDFHSFAAAEGDVSMVEEEDLLEDDFLVLPKQLYCLRVIVDDQESRVKQVH